MRKLIDALPEDGWDQVDFRISPGSASCDCGGNRDICMVLFGMYEGGLFTDWASAVPPDPDNRILGGIGITLNRDAGIDGTTVDYDWYVPPTAQEEAEDMATRVEMHYGRAGASDPWNSPWAITESSKTTLGAISALYADLGWSVEAWEDSDEDRFEGVYVNADPNGIPSSLSVTVLPDLVQLTTDSYESDHSNLAALILLRGWLLSNGWYALSEADDKVLAAIIETEAQADSSGG